MYYETNCTCIDMKEWKTLMKGARKCSYQRLVKKIKRELPTDKNTSYWCIPELSISSANSYAQKKIKMPQPLSS